jgi:hypothetical protein
VRHVIKQSDRNIYWEGVKDLKVTVNMIKHSIINLTVSESIDNLKHDTLVNIPYMGNQKNTVEKHYLRSDTEILKLMLYNM